MMNKHSTVKVWVGIYKTSYKSLKNFLRTATKLKWKLFTKVIKRPSEEAWIWIDRVSN